MEVEREGVGITKDMVYERHGLTTERHQYLMTGYFKDFCTGMLPFRNHLREGGLEYHKRG